MIFFAYIRSPIEQARKRQLAFAVLDELKVVRDDLAKARRQLVRARTVADRLPGLAAELTEALSEE